MSSFKRKTRRHHLPEPPAQPTPGLTALVLIDEEPLRREIGEAIRSAATMLDGLKLELVSFEERDQPAFQSWIAATFSTLLTEIRECTGRIYEKRSLMEAIEEEARARGIGFREAYENIIEGRSRRDAEETGPTSSEDDGGDFGDFTREQSEEDFFWEESEPTPRRPRASSGHEEEVKSLYRILARNLHPDAAPPTDRTRALWIEAQHAYEEGNLEKLQALVEIVADGAAPATKVKPSLWDMKQRLWQILKSVRALRRDVKTASREPAWGFSRAEGRKKRKKLKRSIQLDLQLELEELRESAEAVEVFFEQWLDAGSYPSD